MMLKREKLGPIVGIGWVAIVGRHLGKQGHPSAPINGLLANARGNRSGKPQPLVFKKLYKNPLSKPGEGMSVPVKRIREN